MVPCSRPVRWCLQCVYVYILVISCISLQLQGVGRRWTSKLGRTSKSCWLHLEILSASTCLSSVSFSIPIKVNSQREWIQWMLDMIDMNIWIYIYEYFVCVYVYCICTLYMYVYLYCILYIVHCILYIIVYVCFIWYCLCILYMYILYTYIVYVYCMRIQYIVYVYCMRIQYIYMCFMYRNICCTIVDILDIRSLMIPYQAMFLQNNEPGWNVLSSHWSNSQVGLFKLKMGDSSPAYGHLREHDD